MQNFLERLSLENRFVLKGPMFSMYNIISIAGAKRSKPISLKTNLLANRIRRIPETIKIITIIVVEVMRAIFGKSYYYKNQNLLTV